MNTAEDDRHAQGAVPVGEGIGTLGLRGHRAYADRIDAVGTGLVGCVADVLVYDLHVPAFRNAGSADRQVQRHEQRPAREGHLPDDRRHGDGRKPAARIEQPKFQTSS